MCFQTPNILRLLKSSELSLKRLKFRKYKEESFNNVFIKKHWRTFYGLGIYF